MSPGVLGQVVAAHEAAVTHGTGKPFLSSVGTSVSGQLVRASKSPLAALPLAFEGLLTYWTTDSEVMCLIVQKLLPLFLHIVLTL